MKKDEVLYELINQAGIERKQLIFDVRKNKKYLSNITTFNIEAIEYTPRGRCLIKFNEEYLRLSYEMGCEEIRFEDIYKIRFE